MRWVPGPPPVERPETTAPDRYAPTGAPAGRPTSERPMSIYAPGVPEPDDIPDDAVLPQGRRAPASPRSQPDYGEQPQYQRQQQPAYNAPVYQQEPQQQQRQLPALGPMRGPQSAAAIMPAAVTPPATLACPLVSALDRWVSEGVQPAALRWFGAQVATIKQISAYSCRSMVGAGTSHISEHAFGNALDVAGFTLVDGRTITVKDGWRGSPEEQGFLHDVQLYACETFTTVLSPGYNAAHYDHIHVDLMRRTGGRHPCRPEAIPGEVAAAKARSLYASRSRGPAYTGSIATKSAKSGIVSGKVQAAIPGEDGFVDDDDAPTGSIGPKATAPIKTTPRQTIVPYGMGMPGADGELDDDDEPTGSIAATWPRFPAPRLSGAGDAAIRLEERRQGKSQ